MMARRSYVPWWDTPPRWYWGSLRCWRWRYFLLAAAGAGLFGRLDYQGLVRLVALVQNGDRTGEEPAAGANEGAFIDASGMPYRWCRQQLLGVAFGGISATVSAAMKALLLGRRWCGMKW